MDKSLFQNHVVDSRRIIYTPSVFAKANLIHLQEIGTLEARKPHTSQRENLHSFLFFIIKKGTGSLEYNGHSYPLKKGDCVFLDCRPLYCHRSSENLWTLKWTHFYGSNMQAIYDKYIERGGKNIFRPSSTAPYEHLLDKIYAIAGSSDHIKDMKINETLTSLLTLLMSENWNPGEEKKDSAKKQNLQNIKMYLDEHYAEKLALDDLANDFFINKYYLTRVFKEQFGVTINAYVLQVRITHAKRLLRFSDLPIEAIGHQCGMADANYFSRVFKKIEGCTPGEYRKRW